ncbi:MAG: VWA domain-containing protein [bacterium]
MLRFANPAAFALLALIVAIIILRLRMERGRRPRLTFPGVALLRSAGLLVGRLESRVLLALRLAAILLLVVAAARPQAGSRRVEVNSEGIDIMIALDVSGSMRAEDFRPKNRLHVAKDVVRSFVEGRSSDRIGIVVFAANAFVQCPLTTDYGVLKDVIASVDFGMLEDGTAIGSALASAVNRLRASQAKSRVVILVTDGVNNAGNIDPATAAQLAAAMKIKVYVVGVGRPGAKTPFPVDDPLFGRRTVQIEAQLDEPTLRSIADATNGRYFLATDPTALRAIFDEIGELEKTKIESVEFVDYEEKAGLFLVPAAALLVLEGALAATRFLAVP